MSESNKRMDEGGGTQTLVKPQNQVKEPSFYKVILLNDDFTPMDFVVHILKKFFRLSDGEANRIMIEVHKKGAGIAGVFAKEIAETKVFLVNEYSRKSQYPLKCILEKETPQPN